MKSKKERRSIRLQDYDYALAGGYFVTIATWQREGLFGTVVDREMRLNVVGEIVKEQWLQTEKIRKEIRLDEFAVMPNHFHGIVFIHEADYGQQVGATGRSPLQKTHPPRGPAQKSLGALIAGFKSSATKRINALRKSPGVPVWQRNYYDHIIRSEEDLNNIREYILDNPRKWTEDEDNPANWL